MGSSQSKPKKTTEPETIPVWRETVWGKGNREAMKEKLNKFRPSNPELKYVRILLVGPCGAGKSSFINSVNSIFQDRITNIAPTNINTSGSSYTEKYQAYQIESGDTELCFVFNDVMGLEPKTCGGFLVDDIIAAINGHVKDGHKFDAAKPVRDNLKDDNYRKHTLSDKVFCLAYILPAHNVNLIEPDIFEKMREIRVRIKDLELPQVIVLTNVDQTCPLVKNDLKKIYTSKKIREKMEFSSATLSVPMCHVFPVKNYHEQIHQNDDIDVLILEALTQMVYTADDNARARSKKQS